MSIKLEYWTRDKKTGYDLSNSVNNVKWTTDLNYSAGELTFDLYFDESPKKPALGGIIKYWYNGQKVFYGYVFDVKVSADRTVSVTAYDKLYYLKSQDSIVWPTMTLGSRFNEVCKRARVTHKIVNKPTHKVKAEICEGKTYFDMIKSAVNKTKSSTGSYYFVTTNWSTVELRKAPYKKLNLILGDKSGMISGSLQESITDAYNVVKVYTKHTKGKKTSTARSGHSTTSYHKSSKYSSKISTTTTETPKNTSFTFTTAKGSTIARWGLLQKVVQKKDKANSAQAKAQAKAELKSSNQITKTLTIDCIGNLDFVAGNSVNLKVGYLSQNKSNVPITKAVHTWSGSSYTCSLTLKAGKKWLENGF